LQSKDEKNENLYEKFGFRVVSEKPTMFKLKDGTYRSEFYMSDEQIQSLIREFQMYDS